MFSHTSERFCFFFLMCAPDQSEAGTEKQRRTFAEEKHPNEAEKKRERESALRRAIITNNFVQEENAGL